ncbi:MAG TPA: DCC1-like thiol-disulfide oxidoreductase family protein [Abditibacteriaceae bacterium]|jgi:predicted DCC family thiol-disulfide oxidoreductase YuxK
MRTRKLQFILLYDGNCIFCIRQSARLEKWARGRIRRVSSSETGAMDLHPQLTADGTQARLHLLSPDGRLWGGAEAVARAISLHPVGIIALFYYFPPLRPLFDAAYAWVARNRYRLMGRTGHDCEGDSCRVPFPPDS